MTILKDRFRHKINNSFDKKSNNIEIEVKLKRKTKNGLAKEEFEKIKKFLLDQDIYQVEQSVSTDFYLKKDDIRITYDGDNYFETSKSFSLVEKIQLPDYSVKITVAKEKKIQSKEPKDYKFKREKHRISFIKDNISIDLTEVENQEVFTYEVELEIIDASLFDQTFETLESSLEKIYCLISNDSIYKYIFEVFKVTSITDDSKVSRARDLKIKDLSYNGILQPFAIGVKVDGVNKFLVIHASGVYFYYPSSTEEESIYRISSLNENLKKYENSIFAGELYPKERSKLYIPFDTLIINGKDIRSNSYLDRKKLSDSLNDIMLGDVAIKSKKLFTYQGNVESFNQACVEALEEEKNVPYETDGLIFTPIKSPYIAKGQTIKNTSNRILSKYLDVCKYKRPEDLTIDLLVKADGLYDRRGQLFTGTKACPFTKDNYEISDLQPYLNKVVEFEPHFLENDIVYKVRKIREEKLANGRITLENIWLLAHTPIEEKTLKGQSTQLMRKNNSMIKTKYIFHTFSDYIVDIGFGVGGDFSKYRANKSIKKILAIEPEKERLETFRIRCPDVDSKYLQTVNCGGEDSNLILEKATEFFPSSLKNSNFYISFMISLSFFWKSNEMLSKLIETIRRLEKLYYDRGGNKEFAIIYYSIEGNRLSKLFESRGNKVILNSIILEKISDKQVYIDILDSATVTKQIEYLVFLDDLWKGSSFYPIKENNLEFNKECLIMTKNELIYDQLFVYGKAIKRKINTQDSESIKCLVVDEKIGIKKENKILAKGDDKIEKFPYHKKLYRIANMKDNSSLYHAVLKLLSSEYREGDVYKRRKIAEELSKKVPNNLEDIADFFKIGIIVYEGSNKNKINKEAKKFILLHKCDDKFESLFYRSGEKDFKIFSSDSFLIKN